MLAHFPTRDVDEPLTRDYLDSRLIEFREELRVTLVTEFRAFDAKFAALRQDVTTEIGSLDAKIGSLRQDVTTEIGSLRQDVDAKLLRSLQWTVGTMVALATLIVVVAVAVVTLG